MPSRKRPFVGLSGPTFVSQGGISTRPSPHRCYIGSERCSSLARESPRDAQADPALPSHRCRWLFPRLDTGSVHQERAMRVAVFSTKPYDRSFLTAANMAHAHELTFLEPRLTL